MRRSHEDVILVEEEMRRTIEFGYWEAGEWERRAGGCVGSVDDELLEGLTAYAQEQQDHEIKTADTLTAKWAKIREKGRAYLAWETPTAAGEAVVVALDAEGDEEVDDEEEGPPDYEDEGDDEVLD
jgi:hypothetical protein